MLTASSLSHTLSSLTLAEGESAALASLALMVVGGLGLFLLGMKYLSDGMQAIAGSSLRRMISAVTDNRFLAVATGTTVTCFLQSSSITTVLVVGFVNSGLMLLHQAIGVIMGANIGTTITGWILVLKIGKYGLPMLGVGALVYLFSKRERLRFAAMVLMGLGMVFFGLELMKDGFKPVRAIPAFNDAFLWFAADTYFGVLKCAAVGCLLTLIVQSSSATLAITISLASTGVIPFPTAAALVLGENIGTTITAVLASLGATTNAKRAAYAHVLFNVIGVVWITAIFGIYLKGVDYVVMMELGHHPIGLTAADCTSEAQFSTVLTFAIAATHSGFNILNTILFLPFVRVFARLLERLVPGKPTKELAHLSSLDVRMLETPSIAIEQSHAEILKMASGATKMMTWASRIIFTNEKDDRRIEKLFHREEVLDVMEHEVVNFLSDLLSGGVSHSVIEESRLQLRVADELESISDTIAVIVKAELKIRNAGFELTDTQRKDLESLHLLASDYLSLVIDAFEHNRVEVVPRAHSAGAAVTKRIKDLRSIHLTNLSTARVEPIVSTSYLTMLLNYRRLKDHCLNIAEAVAGDK